MITVGEIASFLSATLPPVYQESYDNSGLLVGSPDFTLKNMLVTLDVTEEVINEAFMNDCNLIVAHHPIIFKGIKSLTGKNYVEKTIIKAIKNDIAIYASHTNLDNLKNGVSFKMAEKLRLKNVKTLSPKKDTLKKLTVFVPVEHAEKLLSALHEAGAGNIGNYSECSFQTEGLGSFKPNDLANPTVGKSGKKELVKEQKIEVLLPIDKEKAVLKAMYKSHPYEEVAYFLQNLENYNQDIGSGIVGDLLQEMRTEYFFDKLKAIYKTKTLRHTKQVKDTVKRVAMCGGAGSFLLKDAIAQKADIYVSADFKYHEFFDAEDAIIIADIGHYESEQYTKELLLEIISNKFPNIAVLLSKVNTNPVFYT